NANPNNNGQGVANNPNNGAGTAPNNGTAGAQPAGTGTPPAGTGATGPSGTAPSTGHSEPSGRGERSARSARSTPSSPSGNGPSAPANQNNSPSPPSGPSAPAGNSCAARCRGDIACLLNCGTAPSRPTGPANNPTPTPSSGGGPETPARSDVGSAMRGVQPAVRACASGQPGPAMITVVFASSGRVTTATVAAPFAGTPAGSCMARAVRAATVPPFTRPTFQVQYPFAL
ncbi:MAG: hypothetical protein JNK05_08760, partial [Myxococcales bacterium]|nr:hypothetical protein [Myxococcales bacterium]